MGRQKGTLNGSGIRTQFRAVVTGVEKDRKGRKEYSTRDLKKAINLYHAMVANKVDPKDALEFSALQFQVGESTLRETESVGDLLLDALLAGRPSQTKVNEVLKSISEILFDKTIT